MVALLPNAPPSPPFSSFSKDELVEMLAEAQAEIVSLRRKLSSDGHVWSWKGDPAGLKQRHSGGKSVQIWSKAPIIDSPPETVSSSLLPSPRLPIELLRAVALECDSQTLGRLTQANFTLLEIASPILYHTLRIPVGKQDDSRTSYGRDLRTFANATYSPSLSALLPRLSLKKFVHLHLPLIERDTYDPQERTQADIERSIRLRAMRDDSEHSEEGESDFDDFLEHPLPSVPPISLPNLQTLNLVVVGAIHPTSKLDLSLCLDLLLTFRDLKEVTFDNAEPVGESWSPFQLDPGLWRRCLGAWRKELKIVRFKGITVEADGHALPAMNRRPEEAEACRFEWEVTARWRDDFPNFFERWSQLLITSVEMPWNRRAGGFRVVVATEEDKEEVQESVESELKEESWPLIQVVVA